MLRPARAQPYATAQQPSKIVFYDGNCPMCNSWVERIIRWDKKKVFRFAALESETAKEILTPLFPDYLKEDTIILFEHDHIYLRSNASLRILKDLGFPLSLGVVFLIVPGFIRDQVYKWFAGRRYKFGKRFDSCPLPPIEWRNRFLH
ncbi:MAG TPA: DCC1-like thiol-disulfide oxidoreductase family protein [Saprospiraceae bacterium]|nr:DCC1-like thiol-disulfide oxidoreductase family protein [Saprospiraceae bacterium]